MDIARGIRVIENAKVLSVSKVTDRVSKLFGETILRIEVHEESFGKPYVDIVPSVIMYTDFSYLLQDHPLIIM